MMLSSAHTSRFLTWSLNTTAMPIVTRYSCAVLFALKPNTAFRYCVMRPLITQSADRSSTTLRWLSATKRAITASVTCCSSVYSVVAFSKTGMATVFKCDGSSAVFVVYAQPRPSSAVAVRRTERLLARRVKSERLSRRGVRLVVLVELVELHAVPELVALELQHLRRATLIP